MRQFLLLIVLMNLSSPVMASNKKIIFKGVDITVAVDFFRQFVTPLKKSITVYNWSENAYLGDDYSQLPADIERANTFWDRFGENSSGSSYGWGLYAANDPVYTWNFGGYYWRLMEMKFPVNFRLLDVDGNAVDWSKFEFQKEVNELLGNFGCPNGGSNGSLSNYFSYGGSILTSTCKDLVKKIFKEELKIQAISYGYGSTRFNQCNAMEYSFLSLQEKAFVVTESSWITPETVSFYTLNTKTKTEDRIRIQTLFSEANKSPYSNYGYSNIQNGFSPENKDLLKNFFKSHPDKKLERFKTICEKSTCSMDVEFCNLENQCEKLSLTGLTRPGGSFLSLQESVKEGKKFLWPDLDGKPKDKNIKEWLLTHRLGCDGKKTY